MPYRNLVVGGTGWWLYEKRGGRDCGGGVFRNSRDGHPLSHISNDRILIFLKSPALTDPAASVS